MNYFKTVSKFSLHQQGLQGQWGQLAKDICKEISQELQVERVGVWELCKKTDSLKLITLYKASADEFSSGVSIPLSAIPIYVEAVRSCRSMAIADVYFDSRTTEFVNSYFPSNNISSMLDSVIRIGEVAFGVICIEHVGPPRVWQESEINLAGSLSEIISNSYLISENRRALEQVNLKSRLASLGEQTADILHEVANPLQVVLSGIDVVRMHLDDKNLAEAKEQIDLIEKSVEKVMATFNAMRTMMTTGQEQSALVVMGSLIDDIGVLINTKLKRLEIEFKCSDSQKEAEIFCVKGKLCQVLYNLINNSADAIMGLKEKWIRVELSGTPTHHQIDIVDSGTGIPSEVAERLFEAFFSTRKDRGGTGLGLSLCQKTIESQQGTLVYDATKPNTTFTILLPKKM